MSKQATQVQVTKVPRSIAVRELIPWMLVVVMVFSIAGVVTGWFIHANAVAAPVAIEQASKPNAR